MASKHAVTGTLRFQWLLWLLCSVSSAHAQVLPASARTLGVPKPSNAADEIQYVVQEGGLYRVTSRDRQRIEVGGEVTSVLRWGNRLYVGVGMRGVIVYELVEPLNPTSSKNIPVLSGKVTGLHVVDGQVWAVVESRSAVPLEEDLTPAKPATSETASLVAKEQTLAPPPAAANESRPAYIGIVRASPGTVEIAIGSDRGARVGDRFVILRSSTSNPDEWAGFQGEEQIAVAEITAVRQASSLAQVSRSAIVRVTDRARAAKAEETESNLLPPRVPRVAEASVVLRPLINVGTPLGVAMLADIAATYWGSSYFAGVRIEPLGLGTTKLGSIVATAALAEGGYDHRVFAAGLGLGMAAVNGDLDHMLSAFGAVSANDSTMGGTTTQVTHAETHTAFALSQVARLGARDGLNLQLRNVFLLHKDSGTAQSGFIYGGTSGKFAVPAGRRADFFAEGGGGVMGYWFFGLGVGSWIVGNGSPGSTYLSVSAGGAGIISTRKVTQSYIDYTGQPYSYTYNDDYSVAGPMVSIGLARRFEL